MLHHEHRARTLQNQVVCGCGCVRMGLLGLAHAHFNCEARTLVLWRDSSLSLALRDAQQVSLPQVSPIFCHQSFTNITDDLNNQSKLTSQNRSTFHTPSTHARAALLTMSFIFINRHRKSPISIYSSITRTLAIERIYSCDKPSEHSNPSIDMPTQPSGHRRKQALSAHHMMKRKKLLIRLDNESDVVVRLVCDKQKSTSR